MNDPSPRTDAIRHTAASFVAFVHDRLSIALAHNREDVSVSPV